MDVTKTPPGLMLESTFASQLPELGVKWRGRSVPNAELLILNEPLATDLGLDPAVLRTAQGIAALTGAEPPLGAKPIAMAYAGHQFGSWSGQLGDGRALLLGEICGDDNSRCDLHLKGSGRTPFARGADGLAALGPMLREYVIGEAMHALGIPTTRALAVLTTGEHVMRDKILPGAVLVRVATSHIRVGTFQWVQARTDDSLLKRLADYTIARHYPECIDADQPYLTLFDRVITAQAELVARWMAVGFIHGVMNTDNMAISGQTIDYGPCAFMDYFDPTTVFSSIDNGGRYAYGAQPQMAQWNLARFAEALLPLLSDRTEAAVECATDLLAQFPARFDAAWGQAIRRRLGLGGGPARDGDEELIGGLLAIMAEYRADYTSLLRALAPAARGDDRPVMTVLGGQAAAYKAWQSRWLKRIGMAAIGGEQAANRIQQINPIYIPRNHLVEEALQVATAGDTDLLDRLVDAISNPYEERSGHERYAEPGPQNDRYVTYCGT